MEEEKVKRIQFDKEVKLKNLKGALVEAPKRFPNGGFSFTDGCDFIIEGYAVRVLLGGDIKSYEGLKIKLLEVSDLRNIPAKITRMYIHLLLEELPDYSKIELKKLSSTGFDKESLFHEKRLMNFASEHICDVVNLERLFEFGWYVVHHLTKEIFMNLSDLNLDRFKRKWEDSNKSFDDLILAMSANQSNVLNNFECITLLAAFKYQFKKEELNPMYMLDYGIKFQKDGLKLNQSVEKLKKLSRKIVIKDLGLNRGNGISM